MTKTEKRWTQNAERTERREENKIKKLRVFTYIGKYDSRGKREYYYICRYWKYGKFSQLIPEIFTTLPGKTFEYRIHTIMGIFHIFV
jgi:hypothetical protein